MSWDENIRGREGLPCLVPMPQYFARVIRFGSHGPGRNPKSGARQGATYYG